MAEKRGLQEDVYLENGSSEKDTKKRTCLEKVLAILFVLALIVIIVLAAVLAVKMKYKGEEVCLTKECSEVAARVISSIDYSVDPCDNFYDFACGSWMKKHVVPEDRSNLYTYGVVRENVKVTIKYLLEGDLESEVDAVRKARYFYQSCMNETQIEHLDTNVITDELELIGGWPVLGTNPGGNWDRSDFDLVSDLMKIRVHGLSPFFQVYVGLDERDSGKRIITIGEPTLGLTREYYFDKDQKKLREAYIKYITNIAVLLGADIDTAKSDMEAVFALDTLLANLTSTKLERRSRDDAYNKMTIEDLTQQYSPPTSGHVKLNWHDLIQKVMAISEENITIDGLELVILEAPKYYKEVFKILEQQDTRTLKNYMTWSVVSRFVRRLPKRFVDEYEKFRKVRDGTTVKESRWKKCSHRTVNTFGMAVGRLFVREAFDEESKDKALDMIHDIREAFNERLSELSWMDEETRAVAKDKALHIREKIGYDDFILNDTALNDYYKDMDVKEDEYFGNMLRITKVWSRNALQSLREPYKKEDSRWETPPSIVNAYYTPLLNLISFPAGMLQPPYYSKYQPRSMNYGSIGFLIGHEITHAFDDIGRKYDKDGNRRQWWSDEAIQRFTNETKCIIDQYNKYVMPLAKLNLDGEYTQGENIADNGGVQQSYKAYQNWRTKSKQTEPKLPGVNFTHNQLFFINFAQGWCGVATKQFEINMVHTDTHSPGRFRITGALQNLKEFSDEFNCPVGSYMNPTNKCHIW
ncbi:neprilysin-1-like isoform X2 [Mercenaria mercenaria]|nr:neprilysin-1-like isoform X2 [Mercenaria mercenaria]XP_045162500.2 neprilysin-1-like isoform X2 [Mercenaria mercenaria]XP_045162501.2 neprilysin-1-like isoform X2 [Mercenaria mercenaria]XP_045162502.2 neprilysin-1-like isoform X2 [Mercenaria mercenaria]XP_045162503.2 neprilysin-1-like isoform X2 [Mercenaria mercenaria]